MRSSHPLRAFALIACLYAAAGPAVAQRLTKTQRDAIDRAARAELRSQNAVGVAIGVLREGRVAYVQGYGDANRESGEAVTTETVFNWASNSKPLMAVAAMQLVESGRLDLDQDVRRYVPEFPPKRLGTITPRHLLCHQSGLPHYQNGVVTPIPPTDPGASECDSAVAAIRRFAGSPLLFAPGEQEAYSSHAYVLLSAAVARAGGASVEDQIRDRITRPLGIASLTSDTDYRGQPNWAIGYVKNPGGEVIRADEYAHCWKHGAGGYKSNIADFAKWAAALLNGRLVSRSTQRSMWTPQRLASGAETERGLGFIIGHQGGLKVSHNGSQTETATRMVLYPDARHGVVVMSNSQYAQPGRFSTAVYRALR